MTDLLISGGRVVTQDAERRVLDDGAVAIEGDRIAAVGPAAEVSANRDPVRTIDAAGHAVLPGLVTPHVHVSDILLRGGYSGENRTLFDWLYNVKRPGVAAMTVEDHRIAAELYCSEAISAGVTTFVENDAETLWDSREPIDTKLDVYDESGIRGVYARGFTDLPVDGGYREFVAEFTQQEPDVNHPDPGLYEVDADTALSQAADLHDEYHGAGDGRLGVWVAPVVVEGMTTEGFRKSVAFARDRDVMTTTHVSESELQEADRTVSSVEYLDGIDYLGEHTLLAHCVHVDDRDVRRIARSGTRVTHNVAANLKLGSGVAPVPSMRRQGVPVAVGTDNPSVSDTISPLADARMVSMVHKGYADDPGLLPADRVLDMVTIEGARAMRRGDDLGSLEAGKLADVVLVDLERPHMRPAADLASTLVYQAHGTEVETVVCNGEVVMDEGRVTTIDRSDLLADADRAASEVADRAGLADGT